MVSQSRRGSIVSGRVLPPLPRKRSSSAAAAIKSWVASSLKWWQGDNKNWKGNINMSWMGSKFWLCCRLIYGAIKSTGEINTFSISERHLQICYVFSHCCSPCFVVHVCPAIQATWVIAKVVSGPVHALPILRYFRNPHSNVVVVLEKNGNNGSSPYLRLTKNFNFLFIITWADFLQSIHECPSESLSSWQKCNLKIRKLEIPSSTSLA